MTDAALSIGSSPLATLLSGAPSESGARIATAQSSDPFAALLASASGTKAPVTATAASVGNADPISALLASAAILPTITPAAAVSPTVVAPTRPVPSSTAVALAGSAQPVTVEQLPAETDPTLPATESKNPDDAATDTAKDKSTDPLAEAIASGATAVLALAPTIVAAPVQAPPVESQIKIDAPIDPLPAAKLSALAGRQAGARFKTGAQLPNSTEAKPQTMAEAISLPTDVPTDPNAEQADSRAPKPHATATDSAPAATVAPELADAVIATLKRSDASETKPSRLQPIDTTASDPENAKTVMVTPQRDDEASQSATPPKAAASTVTASKAAPSEATPPRAATHDAVRAEATPPAAHSQEVAQPALAMKLPGDDAAQGVMLSETAPTVLPTPIVTTKKADTPQPAVQQQPQTTAVHQTAHRRTDELSAPRRATDPRKRVETAVSESSSPSAGQNVAEPAKPTLVPQATESAVQAKGDAVIEQTLTIARDGAWLDRLAHDIARSAGNDGNLQFKLNPQHLGALSVAISQIADGASIRMTADHETTRNILLDAQPRLMAEAQAHGLRISESHVELNQNPPQKQDQGQSQSQNQGNHQSANHDMSRWAQSGAGQNGTAQNGQNRQSSPSHQPFVSNLGRKAEVDPESAGSDSDGLYA